MILILVFILACSFSNNTVAPYLSNMGFQSKISSWILLAFVCNLVIRLVLFMDWNKEAYTHTVGNCKPIPGISGGANDIELLKGGIALVTSGLRSMSASSNHSSKGRIFMVDLSDEIDYVPPRARELQIKSETLNLDTFSPHGITAWTSRDGRVNVYIVNHSPRGDTVEAFTFSKGQKTLHHVRTIRDPLFSSAHDVAAFGPERFYLTNDFYFRHPHLRFLEALLQWPLGSVVYYDGQSAHTVANWLLAPHGLTMDKENEILYVANPLGEKITVFEIEQDNGIKQISEMTLMTSPMNVFVTEIINEEERKSQDRDREIWVGCQPVMHKTLAHFMQPGVEKAPSQVLRVRPNRNHTSWIISEPYADDGQQVSASTSTIYHNDHVLVGSAHEKLMWCPVFDREML